MAFNLFNRRRIDSGSHEHQSFYCKFARFINNRRYLKFYSYARGGDSSDSELVETNQYIGPPLPPSTPSLSGAIVTPKTLTHLLHENPNCAAAATAAHEEDDTTTTFVLRCCLLSLFCLLLREREEPLPYYTR